MAEEWAYARSTDRTASVSGPWRRGSSSTIEGDLTPRSEGARRSEGVNNVNGNYI